MAHKLLLADDSVTIQKVIELTFADEDVQVIAVGNGQLAIERIAAERPDIVLADVGMPERDGYEVAAFIKDTPEFAHIPVLLLTGAFEPVDEEKARAVRCDGVLAKPFEPQLLISRVKELLDSEVGEQTVRIPKVTLPPPVASEPDPDDTGPLPTLSMADEPLKLDPSTLVDAPAATSVAEVSLDDYFDRLDAAFASLTGGSSHGHRDSGARLPEDNSWAPGPPPPSAGWPETSAPSAPVAVAPMRLAADVSAPPAVPAVALPVADAFAALFEAEQQNPVEASPDAAGTTVLPASVVTEDLVEHLARRVVEHLGTAELKGLVTDLVSSIAERLVREEIERLKARAEQR